MYIPTLDLMITSNCNLGCKYCFLREMEQSEGFVTKIDDDFLEGIINSKYNLGFFMFGGEPLLQMDKIEEIYDKIEKSDKIPKHKKMNMLSSMKHIITNGTLIDKKSDQIKKHGYRMQISLDGPKDIHDENRVYKGTEKGSFDKVIDNLVFCKENGIGQSVHGVVQKNTIGRIFDIQSTLQDLTFYLKERWEMFSGNLFMVIFEEDYTDENIDEMIEGWIKTQFYIKEKYGIEQMFKMLNKDGGDCGIGKGLFQQLPDGTLFPCHRYPGNKNIMDEGNLGNVKGKYKDTPPKQQKLVNQFYHVWSKFHQLTIQGKTKNTYICPQTSMETTHSPGMINPKYTQLYEEMTRVQDVIRKKYKDEYDEQVQQKKNNKKNLDVNVNLPKV